MNRAAKILAVGWLAVAMPRLASAQIALYAERLSSGYALVRFANTTNQPVALTSDLIDPVQLGTTGADRVSSYRVVEKAAQRVLVLKSKSAEFDLHLTPDMFQTYVLADTGGHLQGQLIADTTAYNQLRAKLSFYNTSSACSPASLLLDPAHQSIFADLAVGQMRTRSINPAPAVSVRAACGASVTPRLDLGDLDEGGLYSVWLMAPAGAPLLFLSMDKIAAYAH